MYEFKLPDLGEGIHEAEILKWHVKVGDRVEEDAPLVDVETDKATVTIPSPAAGTILKLGGDVGATVTVGQVIAVIETLAGEAQSVDGPAERAKPPEPALAATDRRAAQSAPVTRAAVHAGPVPAAPATRRLARELGVDLRQVPPSGPAGRVTADDVRGFAKGTGAKRPERKKVEEPPPQPISGSSLPLVEVVQLEDFSRWGPVEVTPLRSVRRKVARKMATSQAIVAHVSHTDEADITLLEEFRRNQNQKRTSSGGPKFTLLSFVAKALVSALKNFPQFNASLDPVREELVFKKYYNIGVAADSGKGLVVPVVKDVDRKSLLEVAAEIEDLAGRAKENSLAVEDFKGGTFTVSNIGSLGGFSPNPIVNYPEVAILGMGAWKERPVVLDGRIEIRKMLPLALSFDHRVADGADSARFLKELIRKLSDPDTLLLES